MTNLKGKSNHEMKRDDEEKRQRTCHFSERLCSMHKVIMESTIAGEKTVELHTATMYS
jgi:hypothetical protein